MIDKLNFSGAGNIGSNIESPQSSIGDSLLTLGKYYTQRDSLEQERLRQQEKDAYQRSRDVITDARLNKQEARQDKEQAANDMFYTEFAKGQQNKGGMYGDLITKESDKYAFTDGEIGLATQYKNDPLLARAAGQNALADKLDWQLKAGDTNRVGRFVDSNVDDETRPEMYERIGSLISSKGYTPPKELIIAADQARLAEKTAEEAKTKLLDDQRSDIIKNQRSDLWKNVSYSGSGDTATGTDAEGNQIQINTSRGASAQNRFNNSFNDDLSKGSNDITEAIAKNTKGATDTSKSLTSSDALKFYNKLVKEEGIDPSVAASQIVNGISSQDPKWYQWLTDKEAKFSKDAIAQLLPTLKETSDIKKRTDIANGTNTGVSSKEQAANNLLKTLAENDEVNLSKINEDRAKLLLTPEERRTAKANQWLEREGILGKSSSEQGIVEANGITGKPLEARINKNIKTIDGIPDSLVASEGVTNASYKDGKGYSVAMGYNLHANKDEIEQDFSYAGISKDKAFIAKTRPQDLVLSDEEAQRLSQVAFHKYADNLDKKLGGNFDKLSPQMQTTALQMHYRGDLFNDADYAKQLQKYVAKDDFDGLVKYVSDNADSLPKPLVRRLENDLGSPTLENLRGTMTSTDKDNYLLSKSNQVKTPSGSDNKVVDIDSSPTSDISDKYIKSIFEKEKEASKDDFFGDGSTKANTNLIQSGVSQKDIDRVIQEKKDKEKSDNLIADRNYRVALRNNGIYDGKTAEEWNDLRSTTNKIGDYAWTAPVAAALAPAIMTAASIPFIANTVNGAINSIKSIGEAKRMQQMLDEAITTTSKAKQSAEDLQKIEQLKEAHKYLLQMMRRGMYY